MPGTPWRSWTIFPPATRRRSRGTSRSCIAAFTTPTRCAARSSIIAPTPSCTSRPGSRWASRCRSRSSTTATTSSGTLAVLEAMRDAGVRRFVFSSTCAVYGEPSVVPIIETLEKRPINAYGETKLAIERALPHLERAFGLRWVALRYFNAAGAHPDGTIGEDHDPEIHLIPLAIRAATGGRAAARVRPGLSDARRHLPAGLHPRVRPGRGAPVRARAPSRAGWRRARSTSARARRNRCAR